MKKTGRPTKFNTELADRIVQLIRAGNYAETAAAAAGINKDTFYAWLKEGARSDASDKRPFSDAIEKAMAEAEMQNLALIGKAAMDGVWQAAAWRLERMHPQRYAQRQKVDLAGHDGGPLQVSIAINRTVGK